MNDPYGYELVIDLADCNVMLFNRGAIQSYFVALCDLIDMQRCDLHWWDDVDTPEEEKQTSPHTQGTSAVQFILTSSIVIHTLDQLAQVFINIFSCKDFDKPAAYVFTKNYFVAGRAKCQDIIRGGL
jgi:S-adenosylmethionine/arginine decarboxylase-like enzyme